MIKPLDFNSPLPADSQAAPYLEQYGLVIDGAEHYFGTFRSGRHRLAAYVYRPASPRGTVILVHGYFDHAGVLRHPIRHLVGQGYTVAVYDQPGHGLSSGERATIDDFSTYVTAFEDFLDLCYANLTRPVHAVAHSMGAAVTADYLLRADSPLLDRIVLVAPLVHSRHWTSSSLGAALAGLFVESVPRVFRDNSSDRNFATQVQSDPLQSRRAPLSWFRALVAWNHRLDAYQPSSTPVRVIQGTYDDILDWQYNLAKIASKFPSAQVSLIEGGRHQLFNEARSLREQVLSLIDAYLGQ